MLTTDPGDSRRYPIPRASRNTFMRAVQESMKCLLVDDIIKLGIIVSDVAIKMRFLNLMDGIPKWQKPSGVT